MLFFKRTLPLIITFCTGVVMILAFFSGPGLPTLKMLDKQAPEWIRITMTFAMVLGGVSLLQINLVKISRRVDGWGYNAVLVIGFLTMAMLGFFSGFEGSDDRLAPGSQLWMYEEAAQKWHYVTVKQVNREKATIEDEHTKEKKEVEFVSSVTITDDDGKEKDVQTSKLKGSLIAWLLAFQQLFFNGVFKAAQATMFSLLAFFVASASFRAFRIKSKEAMLLMGAAFIVMLGNVPIGNMLTALLDKIWLGFIDFPALKEWIMMYPSSAAQSAILIGAALGYIAASLKIILGVERSYLGGGEG